MKYVTLSTPTDFLPLPTTLFRNLRNMGIDTVGKMIHRYKKDGFDVIPHIGPKSVAFIRTFIESIKKGDGDYILVSKEEYEKTFQSMNAYERLENTPVSALPLSDKAKAVLLVAHFRNAAQLIGITAEEIQNSSGYPLSRFGIREIISYVHQEIDPMMKRSADSEKESSQEEQF